MFELDDAPDLTHVPSSEELACAFLKDRPMWAVLMRWRALLQEVLNSDKRPEGLPPGEVEVKLKMVEMSEGVNFELTVEGKVVGVLVFKPSEHLKELEKRLLQQ